MEISGDKIDLKDGEATTPPKTDIESQILAAMQSRVTYLRDKADNFTFEGVRRLLEEDLKLEKHALDVHKSFVKQHLVQCLAGAENDETSENSLETEKKDDVTPVKEAAELSKEHTTKKDGKEDMTGDDEKTKDSPVMGLLTEENTSKSVAEQTKDEDKEVLQSDIKKALRKRSSYIKANSEKITMGLLRRLLEQDLKLEKYSLDPYKKFINGELDEILQAHEATQSSTKAQRKPVSKKVKSTPAKNSDSEEMFDSDGEDEEEDKEVAVKKKMAEKRKLSKSEGTGKRKREKEKPASAKKTKQTDSQSDSDAGEKAPSSEKSVKKPETPTTGYGKRVEHLKSIIKSCGMSISPSVYRKAKQAPEEKREEILIKELKELLAKEGLSANPSEKEIKEVKKRKERTKELEGIDTSNIVSSSRRRSSASFVPPPKPIKAEESESDDSVEFDPLPPGAFGMPIEMPSHRKATRQAFETNIYVRSDVKPIKDHVRPIREYQFIPELPSSRTDHSERVSPSHHFGVPLDGSVMRVSAVSAGHRDDYKISPQIPNLNLATHQGKPGHVYSPNLVEYDSPYQKSYMDTAAQVHDDPFVKSEREVGNEDEDDDALQLERHRKNEEARIAREVEAHEKRIRRELEKQDMLRRKREEQIRKEMERQDRERRKEEERLLREKQREEERYLKEQMRELQRREKFLKKETIRAEKMRQKEEMRKEKEVARLKAANERAIARKIAKESMELIEDERLELMEVAALTKGLPSMLALDFETLQNLDEYRDKQAIFPPTSVKLKKPFAVKPWNGSDENVANLLMVWRFLITFADVLGLWPFTLDEFAQAFHDYDPRLMGEIHIVLLKTIIKDIEGVVRTLSTGVGANQNVAANPGGGHPHVVEGAYAWGFDIRSWRKNLNVFTWPEILRQLALSAGLGPQLKKMNIRTVSVHDDNEANNSENVIFNLRKGVAAENAFAKMQERGLSNPRRSRHRLTPGTVKFAAFHVLSLEGEKGLNILEVAEKIQKSGLRDLTTSRTPEASVAAALSRDTKLFERVAPSTYCVRASYRKDAGDAETIFAEARERIRAFKSGITDVEDVDDAERDEDSESDVGEDPEVDLNLKKEDPNPLKVENLIGVEPLLENGKLDTVPMKTELGLPLTPSLPEEMKDEKRDDTLADQSLEDAVANGEDSACFDESKLGEQWVQGLVEGDYSNLSCEERLNALVALIGIATEGNTIRIALEERLEVASALKKQMWGEVQLDKRWKEESLIRANYLSYPTAKPGLNIATPASGNQESSSADVTPISSQDPVSLPQIDVNNVIAGPSLQLQENVPGVENLQYQQQQGYTADRERLRAQLKAYVGYKAEELYVYRSLPLGQDRRRNRYWRFSASASRNDPGCGRIFVELQDGRWRLIDSEEAFDYLVKSLDVRGVRESHLHFMLLKIEASFKEALRRNVAANPGVCSISSSLDSDTAEISTTFKIELGDSNAVERYSVLQRFHSFEKWMWDNMLHPSALSAFKYGAKQSSPLFRICRICAELYFVGDICCPSCGQMHAGPDVGELCFAEQVAQLGDNLRRGDTGFILRSSILSPLRIRLLKVQLALVEASLPPEGLEAFWTENLRKSWGMKLLSSSSPEDLYQVLTTLEAALKRDFLSSNFETTSELLGLQEGALASDLTCGVNVLPWIPKTAGGVALRLFDFDSSIVYTPDQNNDPLKDKESEDFVGLETNILRNLHEKDVMETPVQVAAYKQEENWTDPGLGGVSSSGRGGRPPRGRGRPRARGNGKKPAVSVKPPRGAANSNGETMLRPRAQPRGGRKNGRRSGTKGRKRPTQGTLGICNEVGGGRRVKEVAVTAKTSLPDNDDDWIETPELQDDDGEASSSGRSFQYEDYDDDDVMAPIDDFDGGGESSKLVGRGEFSLHSDDEYEEEEEEEEDMNMKMDVNVNVVDDEDEDYINEDSYGRKQHGISISNDAATRKRFNKFEDPDLTSSSSSDFQ